jgi:hypothetical protein
MLYSPYPHFYTLPKYVTPSCRTLYVKNYMFLMTKNRETSYKEAETSGTFQMYEYSRLALCNISCAHIHAIVIRLSFSYVNAYGKSVLNYCKGVHLFASSPWHH